MGAESMVVCTAEANALPNGLIFPDLAPTNRKAR
jgi:hypothetical protein